MLQNRIGWLLAAALVAFPSICMAAEDQKAPSGGGGADASNPTAAVNFQDVRYRFFDLGKGAEKSSFETEGAYVFHPRLKITNELRYVHTNKSGEWETDLEEFKTKLIHLTDFKPFGIKAKFAIGAEWLVDLGDFKEGTGTGSDKIAPLVGIGWIPTPKDFVITLVQYFYSYDEDDGAPKVRQTGPRLIYIRKLPEIRGWLKLDFKGSIDHEEDEEFSSTLEAQLGHMLTPSLGIYGEFLTEIDSDAYDWGLGIGVRFMY